MKAYVLAIAAVAVFSSPAAAQMRGSSGGGPHAKLPEAPKVDEKAYKAAMERIPVAKEKYDPWGGVAPAPAQTPTASTKKK